MSELSPRTWTREWSQIQLGSGYCRISRWEDSPPVPAASTARAAGGGVCVLAREPEGAVSWGHLPGAGCCSAASSGLYHGLPVSLLEAPRVPWWFQALTRGVDSEQPALGGLRVETSVAL